ncbi:DUF3408 domain-containing protein [Bacteroides ovatus]|nr:DUF3408 domain-containing protein [Bacteroides ovatus]
MAKQSGGMPKIDEDFMKELISQGVPSKQDNNKTNDVPQETQTETVQVEKPTPRKRKGGSGDYRETYFQKVELADRQPLYVSRTAVFRSTLFPASRPLVRGSNLEELITEIVYYIKLQ